MSSKIAFVEGSAAFGGHGSAPAPRAGCEMGLERPPVVSLRSTTGYKLPAPPAQNGSVPCAGLEAPRKTRAIS